MELQSATSELSKLCFCYSALVMQHLLHYADTRTLQNYSAQVKPIVRHLRRLQHTLHALPPASACGSQPDGKAGTDRHRLQVEHRFRAVFTPGRRSRSHRAECSSETLYSLYDFFGSGVTVTKADVVLGRTGAFRPHPCEKLAAGNNADFFLEGTQG
jgi:hypothetical protein